MSDTPFLTPAQLLDHWQGHRRLTRRVIEAFPDEESFATFAIGEMRPFAAMVNELTRMAVPILRGVSTGEWTGGPSDDAAPAARAQALEQWDADTAALDALFADLDPTAFQQTHNAFGQWEGPGYWQILYAIDNEVHHRAQGTVYLRALGVEPPPFFVR